MIQTAASQETKEDRGSFDSCLYECSISHKRFLPKEHKFSLSHFMFYLWLDELSDLEKKTSLFGSNKSSFFRFLDSDHFPLPDMKSPLNERVRAYLKSEGVQESIARVSVFCNVRNFNYVFNPISCFYCFGSHQKLICCVVEVENTFREKKLFLLRNRQEDSFVETIKKNFYVSPFTELDQLFDFKVGIPSDKVSIQIDTLAKSCGSNQVIMAGYLKGKRHELTDKNIVNLSIRHPLSSITVILLIHLHAAILWLKRVPFHRKEERPDLQQNVLNRRVNDGCNNNDI